MTTTDIANILNRAARIIARNGHCQSYLYDTRQASDGTALEYCRVDITGAIGIALHGTPLYPRTGPSIAIEQAITDRIDAPSVTNWSSLPGHGKAEAIALLRNTARDLRRRAS